MMNKENMDTKMATLVESIKNLSTMTANHDVLLTKLVDDHEQRIRLLEKCSLASNSVPKLEERVRTLENWRWYIIGIAAGLSVLIVKIVGLI